MLRINLIGKKRCTKCGSVKDLGCFCFRKGRGRNTICKSCGTAETLRWYKKYPERVKARVRAWITKNPDKIREYSAKYRAANKAKRVVYARVRLERLRNAPGGPFDSSRYAARVAFFGGFCAYCRVRAFETFDHAIPLSRGGSNWPANVYPVCGSCNSRKHTRKLYSEWVPPRLKA